MKAVAFNQMLAIVIFLIILFLALSFLGLTNVDLFKLAKS